MTDNTMREAMIDQDGAVWEKIGGAWSLYKPAQTVPVVGNDIPQDWKGVDGAVAWHLMDRHGEGWAHIGQMMDEWAAANAAQSVAVVGPPVAWVNINKHGDITRTVRRRDNWCTTPVFAKPTTSIPAADLARLLEKAAMVDELRKDAERPDCGTCANRGRVNGLSQETFCEHCSWSENWRKNHYKPTAAPEVNK